MRLDKPYRTAFVTRNNESIFYRQDLDSSMGVYCTLDNDGNPVNETPRLSDLEAPPIKPCSYPLCEEV
jgi:hypothetical protein